MPRALSVGSSPGLEPAVSSQGVVKVFRCPWGIHAFNLDVVAVQQLPRWTSCATRGVADLVVEDDGVGVVDKRDVIAQIIAGKILGSAKY